MYWVPKCEFYFGIIDVVEVAKRIRVDQPKNRGFAKNNCHKLSQVRIRIPLGMEITVVTLFRIRISADARRLANMFGLALEFLNSTLRCCKFLSNVVEQLLHCGGSDSNVDACGRLKIQSPMTKMTATRIRTYD